MLSYLFSSSSYISTNGFSFSGDRNFVRHIWRCHDCVPYSPRHQSWHWLPPSQRVSYRRLWNGCILQLKRWRSSLPFLIGRVFIWNFELYTCQLETMSSVERINLWLFLLKVQLFVRPRAYNELWRAENEALGLPQTYVALIVHFFIIITALVYNVGAIIIHNGPCCQGRGPF